MTEISKKLKLTSSSGVSQDITLYSSRNDVSESKQVIAVANAGGNILGYAPIQLGDSSSWSILNSTYGRINTEASAKRKITITFVNESGRDISPYMDFKYSLSIRPNGGSPSHDSLSVFKNEVRSLVGTYSALDEEYNINGTLLQSYGGKKYFDVTFLGGITITQDNLDMGYAVIKVSGDAEIRITLKRVVDAQTDTPISFLVGTATLPYNKAFNYTSPIFKNSIGECSGRLQITFQQYSIYKSPFNAELKLINASNNTDLIILNKQIVPAGTQIIHFSDYKIIPNGVNLKISWNITGTSLLNNTFPLIFELR